ncbi:class I SAM-dependent methyltransferase [Desulforegula conservatrix]|uniref:class I SAM-dependent methyltransferase n=1 Tax=Desulforegula conservatrix TaxID=153026 RepID=UPI00040FB048|nr:class I SAM-dependent methyltransferase [Desulforegula conservatrix]
MMGSTRSEKSSTDQMRHDKVANSIFLQAKYLAFCLRHINRIKKAKKIFGVSDLVNAVFDDFDSILTPLQIKSEIHELLEILKNSGANNLLEIGSANGGTLFLFSGCVRPNAKLVGIDVPFGRFKTTYSIARRALFKSFIGKKQKLRIIERNSQDISTLTVAERFISGRKFDFIFIDGDHSLEGVKKDFELYSHIVKDGGLICFHDIVHHPPGTVSHAAEVDVFWNSIKSGYDHLEIIESDSQIWGGIGVIIKGGIPSRTCKKKSFGYGSSNIDMEVEGFSSPEAESSFSWTDSDNAIIRTKIDKYETDPGYVLELNAMPFFLSEPNFADVHVNGIKVKRLIFESSDKRIFRIYFSSSMVKPDGKIEIELIFSKRITPFEAGISSDKRKLGLALFDLEIKSTGIAALEKSF